MNTMYRRIIEGAACIFLLLISFVFISIVQAETENEIKIAEETKSAVLITVDEDIRAGTVQFIRRALQQAEEAGDDYFILELNTPGGLLTATEDISRLLVDSSVTTVVYVHKNTGWAFSAGVFILLSADVSASHATANIGAASPVLSSGGDADEKTRNATISWMRSLADRNERDREVAESFILDNATLSGREAFDAGMVDILADSRQELFVQLGVDTDIVHVVEQTTVESIFSFFSMPYLVPLLLTLGSLGLIFAFRTGELLVTGPVSLLLLLLGFWGMGMMELATVGVVLLVVGIGLVTLEFFIGGSDFGISGVLGVFAIIIGIATFPQEPLFPDVISYGLLPILIAGLVSGLAIMLGITYFTATAIRQEHKTGVEVMVGKIGVVKKDISPVGIAFIDGERYTARVADGESIMVGEKVEVLAMEGNVAVVKKSL